MIAPTNSKGPIFILGILGRSGTNYLSHLLDLHPDCELLTALPEDWLLAESHHLASFIRAVHRNWAGHQDWGLDPDLDRALYRGIGQGLLSFFKTNQVDKGKRFITKTPSMAGLTNFFALFPNAYLLINVRDGRDIVESAWHSVGTHLDRIARWWADSARIFEEFDRANKDTGRRYCIVRYEDLVLDLEVELSRVLEFLDLDVKTFPFSEVRDLPVYGSSAIKSDQGGWKWRIADKPENFNPIKRWENWTRKQHERFNWIAGKALPIFDYQTVTYTDKRLVWTVYNLVRDFIEAWRVLKMPQGRRRTKNRFNAWISSRRGIN
ncbi:MAG: sulfotransferase [Anaerolineales bacterium]|nr:sulfotransferase [Anaerolineales bacterium]